MAIKDHFVTTITAPCQVADSNFDDAPDCAEHWDLDGSEEHAEQKLSNEGWRELTIKDHTLLACPACVRHLGGKEAIAQLSTEEILTAKNRLHQSLERNIRAKYSKAGISKLANTIAAFDHELAERYISANEPEKAVVNLISQASCLALADLINEAVDVYLKALGLSSSPKIQEWITKEIERITLNR